MQKISKEKFEIIKTKVQNGQNLDKDESIIAEIISKGIKYIRAFEEILKNGEIDEKQLLDYFNKISALIKKIGFAPSFLVRELPIENIDSFDITKWQAITKAAKFNKLDYESKKACLMLCGTFGIFEEDLDANRRTDIYISMLQNEIQNNYNENIEENALNLTKKQFEKIKKRKERIAQKITPEKLKNFSEFNMNYDPQFLNFWLNIENREKLNKGQLTEIQNNWDKIRKAVEIKSIDNILKYLEVSKQETNSFDIYMKVNNIHPSFINKYRILYEQMSGRTKTSIPTSFGKNKNGYSYEILNFNDPRILRFGEDNLIKCCQKSGGRGESSMIFSAIESSARVIMVRNELGKYIAGSLITHQIGKDGKSHVCFDSIELSANNAHIKTESYKVILRKIEKLREKGFISKGNLEELREYSKNNPPKEKNFLYKLLEKADTHITRKIKALMNISSIGITKEDLQSLETNQKILEVYLQASEDMIKKDKKLRKNQLANRVISEEEYSHLLMQNGLFTIGKNPVSMYLGNLDELKKDSLEQLPVLQKDRSLYKRASKPSLSKIVENVSLGILYSFAGLYLGATVLTFLLKGGMPIDTFSINGLFTGSAVLANIYFKRKFRQGVFSDAREEQRILLDGKSTDENAKMQMLITSIVSKSNTTTLRNKLLYDEFPVQSNPIKISDLTSENKEKLQRLWEVSLYKKNDLSGEKLIIGNFENWAAIFSNKSQSLVLEDILLQNPLILSQKRGKLTDAQDDLVTYISRLSQSEKIIFNCEDKGINRYLSKVIKTRSNSRNLER